MRRLLICVLCAALLLTGCGGQDSTDPTEGNASDLFTDRDYRTDYNEADCQVITLGSGDVVINQEGSYILRGTLADGQVIVDVDKREKVQLILDGASITSSTSAPIYVRQADKVFITLEGENTLANGGSFEAIDDNDIDAAIFSKDDLTLNGEGALTITSPAGHGIVSKDELTITGGSYDITCASHGVSGKDNLCIDGGTFTIAAGKDGLHAENSDNTSLGFLYITGGSFTIRAAGDGVSASATMQIDGGTFDLVTGGGSENAAQHTSPDWGSMGGGMGMGGHGGGPGDRGGYPGTSSDSEDSTSMKGIKASGDLVINGGSFRLDCADDAVHSNTNVTVTDGTFEIATGDDAFHADDTLTIENGTIDISESYEGLEGLHVLVSGGDISLISTDDGLNAAGGTDASGMGGRDQFGGMGGPGGMGMGGSSDGTIVICGGSIYVEARGDGIDANGTLEITGGYTVVTGPTQGDTATLDYDISATITGGTFIGTGASGMAQTFRSSGQGVFAVSVGQVAAGTEIVLTDSDGNVVVSYTPNLNYAVVILSTPEMVSGETYTITIGTASGEFEAY